MNYISPSEIRNPIVFLILTKNLDLEKAADIQEAIEQLKKGAIMLYPTDTIWGLGCSMDNELGVEKIFELKNRKASQSFILLVDSIRQLERYVQYIPEVCYDIIESSNRPITIIYDQPIDIPSYLLAEDGSIGIRVTEDELCRKMIKGIKQPIISTSANISGEKSPTRFDEIDDAIKNGVDIILNYRLEEEMKTPSSIIKIGKDNRVKIIR